MCAERKERRKQRRGGGNKERRGIRGENMPREQKITVCDWKGRVAPLWSLLVPSLPKSMEGTFQNTEMLCGSGSQNSCNQLFWEQPGNFTRELSSQRLTV